MPSEALPNVTTVLPELESRASIGLGSDLDDRTLGALGHKQEFRPYGRSSPPFEDRVLRNSQRQLALR